MGSNRNLMILVVLIVVIGAVYMFASDRRPSLDTTGGFVDLVEGNLSTDEVFGVRLALGGDLEMGFELVQNAAGWGMSDYMDAPVNLNKVRTLLGNLEAAKGELRSDEVSVLGAYALEDSTAYHLSVLDEGGTALVELLLGKASGSGCFLRRAGESKVYMTDHNFLSDFGVWGDERGAPDRNSWLNLVAFEVDRADVAAIEIFGEQYVKLQKEFVEAPADPESGEVAAPADDSYEWRVTAPGNFLATRSRGEGVLSALVSLRARDVLARGEAPEGAGLGDDAKRIVVHTSDGEATSLRFGNELEELEGQVYFRVDGLELVWSIPTYVRDNLFKTASDLKDE